MLLQLKKPRVTTQPNKLMLSLRQTKYFLFCLNKPKFLSNSLAIYNLTFYFLITKKKVYFHKKKTPFDIIKKNCV